MQRLSFVLAALAVISFAVLGGCGGKGGEKESGGSKPTVKAMSPKETVDAFCKSFTEGGKKWETAKPLLTKKAAEFFDMLKQVEEGEKDGPNILSYTIGEEKIDGDKATVMVKSKEKTRSGDEREKEEPFNLKKVDGAWKIFGMGTEEGADLDDEKMHKEMKDMIEMIKGKKGEED